MDHGLGAEVPKLKLVGDLTRTGQNQVVSKIKGVSSNPRTDDSGSDLSNSQIPDVDLNMR